MSNTSIFDPMSAVGRERVIIAGSFTTDSNGTPTLSSATRGIKSIARTTTGVITLTLRRPYAAMLGAAFGVKYTAAAALDVKPVLGTVSLTAPTIAINISRSTSMHLLQALRTYNTIAHDAQDTTIATADASDLSTSKALTIALATWAIAHAAKTTCHLTADATFPAAINAVWASKPTLPADPTAALAEAIAVANVLKSGYNTHYASLTYHECASNRGVISTTDATTQGTLNTLLNAVKVRYNLDALDGVESGLCDLVSGTCYFMFELGSTSRN